MPDTIDDYERRIGHVRSNGIATSYFTLEDKHLARDLERTLINAQQEAPWFLQEMQVDWAERMRVSFGKDADDSQGERFLGFTAKFGVDVSQKTPKLKQAAADEGAEGGG